MSSVPLPRGEQRTPLDERKVPPLSPELRTRVAELALQRAGGRRLAAQATRKERDEALAKIRQMQDEHAERIAELSKAATHDQLTNLPNRRGLESIFGSYRRSNDPTGYMAFIDLDGFKEVNDSLGHQAGDNILTQVARRLGDSHRGTDVLGRLGGDEFVVILGDTPDDEAAINAATKFYGIISNITETDDGRVLPEGFGASIGVAAIPKGATFEEAVSLADSAMYQAKQVADNDPHVALYIPPPTTPVSA